MAQRRTMANVGGSSEGERSGVEVARSPSHRPTRPTALGRRGAVDQHTQIIPGPRGRVLHDQWTAIPALDQIALAPGT
jgi:hypothetical protein